MLERAAHHHGGTTIISFDLNDDGTLYVYDDIGPFDIVHLNDDDRRAALVKLRAAINHELDDDNHCALATGDDRCAYYHSPAEPFYDGSGKHLAADVIDDYYHDLPASADGLGPCTPGDQVSQP